MKTFEESMASLTESMLQAARSTQPGSAFRLGQVRWAGHGVLQVDCDGLLLDKEDLWLSPYLSYTWVQDNGADNLLRTGDRVVLLTQDEQDYYLLARMVRA